MTSCQKRALLLSNSNNCNHKRPHMIQSSSNSNNNIIRPREIRQPKQKMMKQMQIFYSKLPYKLNWRVCFQEKGPFLLSKARFARNVRKLITCQEMTVLSMARSVIAMSVMSVSSIWTIIVCSSTVVLERVTFATLRAYCADSS